MSISDNTSEINVVSNAMFNKLVTRSIPPAFTALLASLNEAAIPITVPTNPTDGMAYAMYQISDEAARQGKTHASMDNRTQLLGLLFRGGEFTFK